MRLEDMKVIKCLECGKEMIMHSKVHRFCSSVCYNKHKNKNKTYAERKKDIVEKRAIKIEKRRIERKEALLELRRLGCTIFRDDSIKEKKKDLFGVY